MQRYRTKAAAASTPQATRRKSKIPSPHSPGAMAVTDGQHLAGAIVYSDGSYFAFDDDDVLVGEFESCIEAMRSIPARGAP